MKQYTCDIAILGGGGAGLMAALRAEEAGLGKIALFEKGKYFGGSIIMAGGFFTTDPPSDHPDSEENAWKLYKAYLETVQYTGNTKLQKAYIFQTRFLSKWLEEKGVEISYNHRGPEEYMMMAESPTEREGGKRLGAILVEMLESECRKSGVDMFLNACGKQVLLNEEGIVTGAVVSLDGEDVQVNAPIVVLACGGVTGSYEKMCEYFPQYFQPGDDVTSKAAKTNSGDGIAMAAAAGAETGQHMGIHLLSPTFNHGSLVVSAVIQNPSCIWLNQKGERFANEAMTKQSQSVILHKSRKCIYAVADKNIKEDIDALVERMPPRIVGKNPDLNAAMKASAEKYGNVLIADSLEQVAEFIGCPLETLAATIEEYNQFCANGMDVDKLKDAKFLKPLTTPPYYVVRGGRYCDCSQGGITVDDELRVMKADGSIIPGLYAMGDNAGGFVTEHYFGGAGMTFALTSGFMSPDFFQEYLAEA